MPTTTTRLAYALLLPGLLSLCPAAAQAPGKLHPYLAARIDAATADEKLPVYFVIGDRLGYDHWFPRVFGMPLAERRAVVVRELREHAHRTQRDLLEYLAAEVEAGNAGGVRGNWLGNFVRAEATPLAILTAADHESVEAVWFDHVPPLAAVEDGRAVPAPAPAAGAGVPPAAQTALPLGPRVPGNGPQAVSADRVWTLGIEGRGVVVMNADSGIDTSPGFHSDLAARVWQNPGEIPGNLVDDDLNGFVDDVNGWNFANDDDNLNDGGGHGSNTAGCIVADGTCDGTTYGMAPLAQVMTGRLGGESSQWDAVQYAIAMGADLQTSSHSYKAYFNPPPNYRMHRDVGVNSLAAGLIRTNSTSNDGSACGSGTNAARKPFNISAPGNLPPPYLDPNQLLRGQLGGVVGVAAWNFGSDVLMSYSPCGPFAWNLADLQVNVPGYPAANWGPTHDDYPWTGGTRQGLLKPDISSPTGTRTTSSSPCSHLTFSGTSNATPNVIGVMALWKSANPSLTPEDAAMIVHQSARDRGAVPGKENDWGAGVVDAHAGVRMALCVHRVDGRSAYTVEHSAAGPAMHVAVDTVPNSFAAAIVGFSRAPVALGPVTIGVGPTFGTLFAGFSGPGGDLATSIPIGPWLVGLTFYTQGLVWDQVFTNEVLASNVIGTTITP